MEQFTELFITLGIDLEQITTISLFVYVIVEAFKVKLPFIFMGGWKTDILALALSFGMSYLTHGFNTVPLIVSTVICYLAPVVLHKKLKGE